MQSRPRDRLGSAMSSLPESVVEASVVLIVVCHSPRVIRCSRLLISSHLISSQTRIPFAAPPKVAAAKVAASNVAIVVEH